MHPAFRSAPGRSNDQCSRTPCKKVGLRAQRKRQRQTHSEACSEARSISSASASLKGNLKRRAPCSDEPIVPQTEQTDAPAKDKVHDSLARHASRQRQRLSRMLVNTEPENLHPQTSRAVMDGSARASASATRRTCNTRRPRSCVSNTSAMVWPRERTVAGKQHRGSDHTLKSASLAALSQVPRRRMRLTMMRRIKAAWSWPTSALQLAADLLIGGIAAHHIAVTHNVKTVHTLTHTHSGKCCKSTKTVKQKDTALAHTPREQASHVEIHHAHDQVDLFAVQLANLRARHNLQH